MKFDTFLLMHYPLQITPLSHQNLPSLQESTTQTSTGKSEEDHLLTFRNDNVQQWSYLPGHTKVPVVSCAYSIQG